jgi:hypothetical protein
LSLLMWNRINSWIGQHLLRSGAPTSGSDANHSEPTSGCGEEMYERAVIVERRAQGRDIGGKVGRSHPRHPWRTATHPIRCTSLPPSASTPHATHPHQLRTRKERCRRALAGDRRGVLHEGHHCRSRAGLRGGADVRRRNCSARASLVPRVVAGKNFVWAQSSPARRTRGAAARYAAIDWERKG